MVSEPKPEQQEPPETPEQRPAASARSILLSPPCDRTSLSLFLRFCDVFCDNISFLRDTNDLLNNISYSQSHAVRIYPDVLSLTAASFFALWQVWQGHVVKIPLLLQQYFILVFLRSPLCLLLVDIFLSFSDTHFQCPIPVLLFCRQQDKRSSS